MTDSENDPNARVVAELKAALNEAAAKRLNRESEPAFVYTIETSEKQSSGERE